MEIQFDASVLTGTLPASAITPGEFFTGLSSAYPGDRDAFLKLNEHVIYRLSSTGFILHVRSNDRAWENTIFTDVIYQNAKIILTPLPFNPFSHLPRKEQK